MLSKCYEAVTTRGGYGDHQEAAFLNMNTFEWYLNLSMMSTWLNLWYGWLDVVDSFLFRLHSYYISSQRVYWKMVLKKNKLVVSTCVTSIKAVMDKVSPGKGFLVTVFLIFWTWSETSNGFSFLISEGGPKSLWKESSSFFLHWEASPVGCSSPSSKLEASR